MTELFIHWNVDPVMLHLGSFSLRWYSFGFLFAFLFGYIIMNGFYKKDKVDSSLLDSLVVYIFLGVLVGARLGHCLFYEPSYYLTSQHWWEIVLPFDADGHFTGYEGLASHGAAIGILIALGLYCRKFKTSVWWVVDRLVIVVALGGAFIRLGNLMNSEIYGVETSLPWGFVFERNHELLPKHPTQLYESLSYLIIFGVSYFAYLRKKGDLRNGRLFGWWLIALFGMRFLIEFVKNPQVGFENGMLLDMGQLLSLPFILGGVVILYFSYSGKIRQGVFTDKTAESKYKKK